MSYPDIDDPNFYKKINKKFKNYHLPKKKKSFKQICFPQEFQLQLPQKFLAQYINPKTPYKGVLIFHRIGAGKTCTAVSIGEQWKKERKIIVLVPASLRGNFRKELRSMCAGNVYLSTKERKILDKLHPSSKEYKDIIKQSDARIDKHYRIYSYNQFVDLVESNNLSLRKSVLIIDEVQNMVSEEGKYYKILLDTIKKAPKDLRIVLMTATPMFDKPIEVALTLNLLRLPIPLPTGRTFEKKFITVKKRRGKTYYEAKNMDEFKKSIKGYVSYFRGAPPYAFPERILKYVKCEMSDFQYRSYLTAMDKEGTRKLFKEGTVKTLPSNFFLGARVISNVAFPNKHINIRGYQCFRGKFVSFRHLKKYSIKFYKIMRRIISGSGTVFVYSNFKEFGGIKSFINVLEGHGFKDYSKHGEGWRRFAVWSGDESDEQKDEVRAVFNQPKNRNGSRIKVLLGSPSIKEGVTLLRVQQVHIMEPYWNQSRMEQVIGRAIRYCSHKDMPEEKRSVKVYIYIAVHPNEKETVDQYINRLSHRKNKLIKQFEMAVKEAAVDCTMNKPNNVYKGEEDIKCECN